MGSETAEIVCVVSTDPSLRRSLARWVLERSNQVASVKEADSLSSLPDGAIVLATATDCPPASSRRIVDAGGHVIVVAAYPSDSARADYEAAGAIYLAMSSDTGPLEDALNAAVRS